MSKMMSDLPRVIQLTAGEMEIQIWKSEGCLPVGTHALRLHGEQHFLEVVLRLEKEERVQTRDHESHCAAR